MPKTLLNSLSQILVVAFMLSFGSITAAAANEIAAGQLENNMWDIEYLRQQVILEAGNFGVFWKMWYGIQDFYDDTFGMLSLFFMFLTPIVLTIVLRLTYGFIIRKIYHYDMITNPATALTLAGYGGMSIYAIVTSAEFSNGLFALFVVAGLPGTVYYFIYTLKMTRNIVITIINTVLMYVLIPLLGAAIVFMLIFAGIGGMAGQSQSYKCGNCGRTYKSDVTCRCGGSTHI